MRRTVLTLILSCLMALGFATWGLCEDLVGTVADGEGQAVQGARVVAHSSDGATTQAAITDVSGQYRMSGLDPGQYFITLQASSFGGPGQTVAGYVGSPGLTVNWSVAPGLRPIAAAQPGVRLNSADAINPSLAAMSAEGAPPPGCRGMPGPPCGPKKSRKRCDDDDGEGHRCHDHDDD